MRALSYDNVTAVGSSIGIEGKAEIMRWPSFGTDVNSF